MKTAPVYCSSCGKIMHIVVKTVTKWHWNRHTQKYHDITTSIVYLHCHYCYSAIHSNDFASMLTEEQKGGINQHLLGI